MSGDWRERLAELMRQPSDLILDDMPGGRLDQIDAMAAEISAAFAVAEAMEPVLRVNRDFPGHDEWLRVTEHAETALAAYRLLKERA